MRVRACSVLRWTPFPCHRAFSSFPGRPRPYTFHVGASFIGKPDSGDDQQGPPLITTKPFPSQHPVVPFRDRMLSWERDIPSTSAGQDFFYVQEVSKAG